MRTLPAIFCFLATLGSLSGKQNVLLIISDDQAWNDYSFMGHEVIETPRLDRLAKESLTYTRGYVTSPLCRPSLASMFTGLATPEHGITGNDLEIPGGKRLKPRPRRHPDWKGKHEQIYQAFEKHAGLAGLLKDAGYLTLQTGKWWEGDPKRFGFTHTMTHGDPERGGRHGDAGLKISRKGIEPIKNFLDEAASDKKPFFIWHAPFLPHTPHTPPKELFDKYLKKETNRFVARYYAMVEWFDQTCGELLDELDQRGLSKDTVIIYVTDNGWIQSKEGKHYDEGSKQSPYEGGIRTPIMVRWPEKVEARMDEETLVSSLDIAPTVLNLCGVKVPKEMKGIDLREVEELKKRNAIFGYDAHHDIKTLDDRHGNLESRYVVSGDWKLIAWEEGHKMELFHVRKDVAEKKDRSEVEVEKKTLLLNKLNDWWSPSQ